MQIKTGQVAGLCESFAKGCLTAAAWTLDEPGLAAAENVLEVDEHSALNDIAGLSEKIGKGGRSIRVDEQARIYRRQVRIMRDH